MHQRQLMVTELYHDVIWRILIQLDPVSLYYFSSTNQFFYIIGRDDHLWKMHLYRQFPIPHPIDKKTHYFSLFNATYKEYYAGMTTDEKTLFTLIRTNDVAAIKEKKIKFTVELLHKTDNKKNTLLKLIRESTQLDLKTYVFSQLHAEVVADNESQSSEACTTLIKYGIQFNLANDLFTTLINKTDKNLSEWLFYAVECNALHSAALLLKLKANPNYLYRTDNNKSYTPLVFAACHGYLEMINLLLDHQADINNTACHYTALCAAVAHDQLEIIKCLVKRGASVNASLDNGIFPLYAAMRENKLDILHYLLNYPLNLQLQYEGYSALYIGAKHNNVEGIKALIQYSKKNNIYFDLNQPNGKEHCTALYVAAERGYSEIASLLLIHGADVNAEFMNGFTPLYVATLNHHLTVIEVLSQYNPDYISIVPGELPVFPVTKQDALLKANLK